MAGKRWITEKHSFGSQEVSASQILQNKSGSVRPVLKDQEQAFFSVPLLAVDSWLAKTIKLKKTTILSKAL